MNKNNLYQIFDHYIARFNELNDSKNSEYYKWEIAAQFRPMMDEALAAESAELPAKLAAVVLLTEQTIDNQYELSFYALSDYAKKEPEAVRNAIKALLSPDDGDLVLRKQRFMEFLSFCDEMHQKYNPDSWRYQASIRLPMMITGFYDPDNYYLYKASQAQAYADCVEFYDDWGSGANIDLGIYHRMCNELVAAIKENDELLKINQERYSFSKKPMHPDAAYHLLAFDIIFCSTVYNLYDGIHYGIKNAAEKKAYLTKQVEAKTAAAEQQEALEQAALLDKAEAFFMEKLSVGKSVQHKTFGAGTITAIPNDYTVEATFPTKDAPVKLGWRVCITGGIISFKTAENAAEYDDMVTLIRRADMIRRNVTTAEKKLIEYAEYLQI